MKNNKYEIIKWSIPATILFYACFYVAGGAV